MGICILTKETAKNSTLTSSVPDPNPDPHVFGPPGSGSISQMYGSGSGSGSFYHQAKKGRKTLIPTVLWLLLAFLSLKNDVNVPSKSNKKKNCFKKIRFLLESWRSMTKIEGFGSGSRSIIHRHGSANKDPDPDPYQKLSWIRNTAEKTAHTCRQIKIKRSPGISEKW